MNNPSENQSPFTPTGPNAYQTGGFPPAGSSPVAAPKEKNTVATVALVLAIIGAVFAVIEGAYIIGWVLLPVAFILSIVALAQRGRRKGKAWAALALAIIGTIAGLAAFSMTVSNAVEDAFGNGDVDVVAPTTAASAGEDAAPAAAAGSRENPLPLGSTIATDKWQVTVNSFIPDATEAVLAENPINEAPADGHVYALINVTITYLGEESAYAAEVSTNYVTSTGTVVDGTDAIVVAPDSLGLEELYNGASVTGNVVRQIPAGDAGTIRITPGFLADDAFFGLS